MAQLSTPLAAVVEADARDVGPALLDVDEEPVKMPAAEATAALPVVAPASETQAHAAAAAWRPPRRGPAQIESATCCGHSRCSRS